MTRTRPLLWAKRLEFLPIVEPVGRQRVAVGPELAGAVPVAERTRGDSEQLGSLRDREEAAGDGEHLWSGFIVWGFGSRVEHESASLRWVVHAELVALQLVLSACLACLGVWFHLGIALRRYRKDGVPFCFSGFWGNVMFRSGEAVLLTFALFLWFWTYGDGEYTLFPIAALFFGMFIKTGERFVQELGSTFSVTVRDQMRGHH